MLRQGELTGMRWTNLDEADGLYFVREAHSRNHGFTTTKTASSHAPVPVPAPLLADLREHRRRRAQARLRGTEWEDNDLIFPTFRGALLNHCWCSDGLKQRMANKAGVRPVTLRKTGATLLEGLQVSSAETQEALRHKRPSVADRYVAVSMEQRRGHIEELAALLYAPQFPLPSLKAGYWLLLDDHNGHPTSEDCDTIPSFNS